MHKMSKSFSVSSQPTSETNGKNSSSTSTCNGGVHVCPFQLAPPISHFTYCVLKRVCRQILKEMLSEEQEQIKNDLNKIQNKDKPNSNTKHKPYRQAAKFFIN
ncbi:uncharacterized protein LOC129942464 [Eupeodes corollae]|uniref:uncharacterized protein LOC129942464 n=1 Tax=Eupeodes corollae TaxID=290404 RepID=UPI00248FBBBC|nr:uncharacterized protein LOC129942464 [Eupeodes corollae]